jgi:hypothetical protein
MRGQPKIMPTRKPIGIIELANSGLQVKTSCDSIMLSLGGGLDLLAHNASLRKQYPFLYGEKQILEATKASGDAHSQGVGAVRSIILDMVRRDAPGRVV